MKIKRIVLASLCAVLLVSPAFATGASLDIGEAVRLTLANNSSLRSLRQEVVKAQAFISNAPT